MTRSCLIRDGMLVPDVPPSPPDTACPVLKIDARGRAVAARQIERWERRGRPTHENFLDAEAERAMQAKRRAKARR